MKASNAAGAFLAMAFAALAVFGISFKAWGAGPPLKIGLLPVADTIILIAADEKGFFAARGLDVELVLFHSAMEKDAVAQAGSLDGHFCEIISVIVQSASGADFEAVAITSHTNPNSRMFGLVTSPGHAGLSMEDLKGMDMLNAKRTITDFLTDVFFEELGLPIDYMQRTDIRKIPVRMQLLLADQGAATLIPEPMLTLAEKAGGKVLMDDASLDMPLATVALRGSLPEETKASFQNALSDAVSWINQNPKEALDLMEAKGLIIPEIKDSYKLPVIDQEDVPFKLPDEDLFDRYVRYLQRIEVLEGKENPDGLKVPAYEDVVWRKKEGN
jgi:NitT/TauT family transport system substrate-binding protein